VEISKKSMPDTYPGKNRVSALETLVPAEEELLGLYEKLAALLHDEEITAQLKTHMMLKREHLFTQEWLLKNTKRFIA